MVLYALAFVMFREPLVRFFIDPKMDPAEARALLHAGMSVMVAAAIFQVFDAVAITTSGALRGAGDTIWPGVVTVVLSWVCIVGIGHLLLVLAPGLGLMGPWIGASAYIILLGVLFLVRFVAGRWKHIDVLGDSHANQGAGFEPGKAEDAARAEDGTPAEGTTYPAPTEAIASGLPGEA